MENKLDKLRKILEVSSRDTISAKEVEQFLILVLNTIKKEKESFEDISSERMVKIDVAISKIETKKNELTDFIDSKIKNTRTDFTDEINLVKNLLSEIKKIKSTPGKDGKSIKGDDGYTPIKGIDYFDGKDGKDGVDGENGSPDTAIQIADKLNTLEEIIDQKVIKGLSKKITDLSTNIAHNIGKIYTGISETRALELIRDNPSSSSGGGTWGSITGTLSDQTDLQSALNAKQNSITTGTTAQYFRGDLSLATFPTALSSFTNDSGYITGNQSITLSGDVTGSGTTGIVTTIANGAVDIAMLSATGTPSASTYLRGDNTWATVSGGPSFGTDNQIPYTNAGGTDFDYSANLTFNGTALALAGNQTISQGTISSDVKALDISSTWNNAAVAFTGIKLNVTQTASSSSSILMDLQRAGTSVFKVARNGAVTIDPGSGFGSGSGNPVLTLRSFYGTSSFYGDASSILHLTGGFQVDGTLYLGSGIGFQVVGQTVNLNSGNITNLNQITNNGALSFIKMYHDYNGAAVQADQGIIMRYANRTSGSYPRAAFQVYNNADSTEIPFLVSSQGFAWLRNSKTDEVALTIKGATSQTANLQNWIDSSDAVLASVSASGDISVPDEAYGSGWNGSTEVPTKNALYDKIETLGGGSPGGSDTQFQYNNGGSFGGVANLTFNDTSGAITFAGSTDTTQWIFKANATQTTSNPFFKFQDSGGSELGRLHFRNDNALSLGFAAGDALTSGTGVYIGRNAGGATTTGDNIVIGNNALVGSNSGSNTIVGNGAGNGVTGTENALFGSGAGGNFTAGSYNSVFGSQALTGSNGNGNSAFGAASLEATSGAHNVAFGRKSGSNISSGNFNYIFGSYVDAKSATADGQLNIGNTIFGKGLYATASSSSTTKTDSTIGIGIDATTTSTLTLRASTTSISSLNIPSGTAPSSPVDGDIWFDGTDIKMRIGGTTKTFTLT
jgi:hypothetical protein